MRYHGENGSDRCESSNGCVSLQIIYAVLLREALGHEASLASSDVALRVVFGSEHKLAADAVFLWVVYESHTSAVCMLSSSARIAAFIHQPLVAPMHRGRQRVGLDRAWVL